MRNYLIFGGRDSRDFGVYISGQGTFGAPAKAYDFYSIPGRNGALIGNERRLENIEVSYECFIYSNFSENIANFRSFLLSLDGYQTLTDSYHADEFRLACYVGPFEPTVERKNDVGSFTLTFNCKPQRYLTSGQTTYSWVSGGDQTLTGEELTVLAPFADPSVLKSDLAYNLHFGTASKFGLSINGEVVAEAEPAGSIYSASLDWIAGTGEITREVLSFTADSDWEAAGQNQFWTVSVGTYESHSLASYHADYYSFFRAAPSYFKATGLIRVQTRSQYNSVGEFKAALRSTFGSSYIFGEDMELTTPRAFSFTPFAGFPTTGEVTVKTLINGSGTKALTTTMAYNQSDGMTNPTLFPSQPLIRVYGSGVFTMDGVTVTIDTPGEYTDIDCELMDCYEGSTNRNANVTFSTYDFPKLQVGENAIEIVSGISGIEITPRWWRL